MAPSTSEQVLCNAVLIISKVMRALNIPRAIAAGYPSLFILPQISSITGGLLTTIGLVAYTSLSKQPPRKVLRGAGLVILLLLALQELRFERSLIEDFTPYTEGKFFRDSIHYLKTDSGQETRPCLQLFHGFGASSLSFLSVINHFRDTAHVFAADLVGFGFNKRSKLSKLSRAIYSPRWNAAVSHQIVNGSNIGASEYVVVGHSMGAIPAIIATALRRHESPTTNLSLVLEAPALNLESSLNHIEDKEVIRNLALDAVSEYRNDARIKKPFLSRLMTLPLLPLSLLRWMGVLALRFLIRRLTQLESLWNNGLKSAFYDFRRNTIPGPIGYSLPSKAKGFDKQFIDFVLSPAQFRYTNRFIGNGITALDALRALHSNGVRITLVHGKNDKVVPLAVSRRIKSQLSGIELHEIDECGHIPHEERPEVFNAILDNFVIHNAPHTVICEP